MNDFPFGKPINVQPGLPPELDTTQPVRNETTIFSWELFSPKG